LKSQNHSAYSTFQDQIEKLVNEMLGDYTPQKVRDNKVIRDSVFGFNLFYRYEINLLDCPIVQRLRFIHQTSFAYLTYPSATHTRFEHSIGCAALAERILRSLLEKKQYDINETLQAEVRVAALLHDVGHGPFSHASEQIYKNFDEIINLKNENSDIFGEADAHEIVGYFIVKSERFKNYFNDVRSLYEDIYDSNSFLNKINLDNVASIIIGFYPDKEYNFLAEIINGPFDVDKLDYIIRDGYFTGLRTTIDIDRLFYGLTIEYDKNTGTPPYICVDIEAVTPLEQLLFNKMLLFSSVYHHPKIRAALKNFLNIFNLIRGSEIPCFNNCTFSRVVDFLKLDDYKFFNGFCNNSDVNQLIYNLKNRVLFKKTLVLCRDSLSNIVSNSRLSAIRNIDSDQDDFCRLVATEANVDVRNIAIDFPDEPRFAKTALGARVKITSEDIIPLNKVYPTDGWVLGHSQYRYKVFIFCMPGKEKIVAKAAFEILRDKFNIKVKDMAFYLANHEPEFVHTIIKPSSK